MYTLFEELQNRISYFARSSPGGRLLLAGTSQAFIAPNTLTSGPATPRGLFPAAKKDWGPRVGLAFRPFNNSPTAIRTGHGIFYTMADGQTERQLERNPPGAQVVAGAAEQDANSTGPAAVIKVERRLPSGLSRVAPVTFSKEIATSTDINEAAANCYNLRLDRGRSLNDIGRSAIGAVAWEIPVGPGKSFLTTGPVSKILGNWQTSSIVSLRAGFPFSIYASGDVCNCSLSRDERAQQVGDPRSGFTQSRVKWFNTGAFVQPRQGTFGNSGKHILTRPGAAHVDLSV